MSQRVMISRMSLNTLSVHLAPNLDVQPYLDTLHSDRWRVRMLCVWTGRNQPPESTPLDCKMPKIQSNRNNA